MNALVIIDTDALTPATVFAPGGVEGIISKLETDVRAIDRDISTPDGREAVKSLAYKIARSKTALDDMGKELVAGIKAQAATIDAERRIIRERLDALKNEVRDPLTAWEAAEDERITGHELALAWLVECDRFATSPTAAMIRAQILDVDTLILRDWQEFKERGDVATAEAFAKLEAMLATAEQAERDAAELAELRRLKAEREESDRKAAEAAQAEEQARLIAEAKAAREAQEAAATAERHRQNEERAARNVEVAKAAAVEQERQRLAEALAVEERARLKREANTRHRAKIHREITLALSEVLTGNADEAAALIEAIAAGKIPHVSITY